MAEISQEKYENEECEENVTDSRTQRGQSEEQIAENAAPQQGKQVEKGFACGKEAENFLNRSQSQHQKHPNGAQEEAQDEGKAEGIERGMIVVEHPSFGHIMLDSGIEKG